MSSFSLTRSNNSILLIIIASLYMSQRLNATPNQPISDKLCDETYFKKSLESKDKTYRLKDLQKVCNKTYHNTTCNDSIHSSKNIYITLVEDSTQNHYHLRVVAESITQQFLDSGCWGIGFQDSDGSSTQLNYTSKTSILKGNSTNISHKIYYKLGFTYDITVMALPNGYPITFKWKAPDRCELSALDEVHRFMAERKIYEPCLKTLDLQVNFNVARQICTLYDNPTSFYKALKRINVVNCVPVIVDAEEEEKAKNSPKTIILSLSIMAVVMILFVFTFVMVTKKQNLKLRKKSSALLSFNQKTSISVYKEQPTVMIIQRDGCEILEQTIIEFTSLLRSYGVEVKLTTSFGNSINDEGGIASYLQNNINLCDFVFVMVTENDESSMNPKHRSYEFAVKMMEGTVVHCCANAHYLPIYMTSYNKAIKFFPPFLKASTSYGFQIPNDALTLIKSLFGLQEKCKLKEQKIKDEEYMKRLTELSKVYASSVHSACNKEYCPKGLPCKISDNISSIWASTIQTKWRSRDSLSESGIELMDNHEFEDENENEENSFDKV